jgi:hypothetical protein
MVSAHPTAACAGPAVGEGLLGGCRYSPQRAENAGFTAVHSRELRESCPCSSLLLTIMALRVADEGIRFALGNPRETRKVLISYRRDDTAGHAGRVHGRLERDFGQDLLFMALMR